MSNALSRKIWYRYLYPIRSYWHFSFHIIWKSKIAAAFILDFQVMWTWPFRRVDNVVFKLCTKFGSNIICYSHWDRRTYASDIHLMTLRKLTFGFDSMAAMHLLVKFGADIFIQSGDIFSEIQDGGHRHLGFVGGAMGPPTKAHSWCVLPVNISSWSAK